MPRYQLIIFDCDGVMFDSLEANRNFYNCIRSHFNMPELTDEELAYVHVATMEKAIDHILPDERLRAEAHIYRQTLDYTPFNRLMTMEPGLVPLLDRAKGHFRLAVCTNRSNTIGPLLKEFGLTEYFDYVVSSLDVANPKPDPEPVLLILDRLAVQPEAALFIGDSLSDQMAARGAGVDFAAYNHPELEADFHIAALDELNGLLKS